MGIPGEPGSRGRSPPPGSRPQPSLPLTGPQPPSTGFWLHETPGKKRVRPAEDGQGGFRGPVLEHKLHLWAPRCVTHLGQEPRPNCGQKPKRRPALTWDTAHWGRAGCSDPGDPTLELAPRTSMHSRTPRIRLETSLTDTVGKSFGKRCAAGLNQMLVWPVVSMETQSRGT